MCIDLLPEKPLQAIKRNKNDMNRTLLPQFFSYTNNLNIVFKSDHH